MHHFLMIQLDNDMTVEKQRLNLTQKQIDEKYDGQVEIEQSGGLMCDVLCNVLRPIAGIDKIIVPDDNCFRSSKNNQVAISC